jgi:hypothetical protein
MTTFSTLTIRLLTAGGFAVAVAAAPVVVALSTPAAPSGPALADCPMTEVVDPNTGACRPINDQAPPTTSAIEPGITDLQPGALTQTSPGHVGQLPEVNGVPCNGGNTGLCIGLEQNNPANTGGVTLPHAPIGVTN